MDQAVEDFFFFCGGFPERRCHIFVLPGLIHFHFQADFSHEPRQPWPNEYHPDGTGDGGWMRDNPVGRQRNIIAARSAGIHHDRDDFHTGPCFEIRNFMIQQISRRDRSAGRIDFQQDCFDRFVFFRQIQLRDELLDHAWPGVQNASFRKIRDNPPDGDDQNFAFFFPLKGEFLKRGRGILKEMNLGG